MDSNNNRKLTGILWIMKNDREISNTTSIFENDCWELYGIRINTGLHGNWIENRAP